MQEPASRQAAAPAVRIDRAHAGQLDHINARYAEIDFLPSAPDHLVAVAQVGDVMAGLGRIVPVAAGVGELGGMYVFDGWKGHGLAKRIIDALRQWSSYDILYCIPFSELEGLYLSMGFVPVEDTGAVPPAVAAKHGWCRDHYPQPTSLLYWRRPT